MGLGEKSVISSMTWSGVAFVSKSNSNRVRMARTYQDAHPGLR
jgi:hypothetical protein